MATAHEPRPDAPLVIDPDLIRKYDGSGPRYTSYPTADRFVEAFDAEAYRALAAAIATSAARATASDYTCTCRSATRSATTAPATRSRTRDHAQGRASTSSTCEQGNRRWSRRSLGERPRASRQMHWGGGTPTFLSRRRDASALVRRCATRVRPRPGRRVLDRGRPAPRRTPGAWRSSPGSASTA